jgi:hypothetical protein
VLACCQLEQCCRLPLLQVKYQQLAAASFLAEVVKVMQRVTSQAAEAACAEPDEDMVRCKCGAWGMVFSCSTSYTSHAESCWGAGCA